MKTRIKDLQKGDEFLRFGTMYLVTNKDKKFVTYKRSEDKNNYKKLGAKSMEIVLKS